MSFRTFLFPGKNAGASPAGDTILEITMTTHLIKEPGQPVQVYIDTELYALPQWSTRAKVFVYHSECHRGMWSGGYARWLHGKPEHEDQTELQPRSMYSHLA